MIVRVLSVADFYLTLQFCRRVFDFHVAILASSASCSEKPATVNIREIAKREFVSAFCIRTEPLVDSQMPLCIFTKSVQADKLIFLICGRTMSAPRAFTVRGNLPVVDEFRREGKGIFV